MVDLFHNLLVTVLLSLFNGFLLLTSRNRNPDSLATSLWQKYDIWKTEPVFPFSCLYTFHVVDDSCPFFCVISVIVTIQSTCLWRVKHRFESWTPHMHIVLNLANCMNGMNPPRNAMRFERSSKFDSCTTNFCLLVMVYLDQWCRQWFMFDIHGWIRYKNIW